MFCLLNTIKLNSLCFYLRHERVINKSNVELYTKSKIKLPWKLLFKNHANNKLNKQTFMICSTLKICWKYQIFYIISLHYTRCIQGVCHLWSKSEMEFICEYFIESKNYRYNFQLHFALLTKNKKFTSPFISILTKGI